MKPKELVQFVEENARVILAMPINYQTRAMMYGDSCVLRPFRLPDDLIIKMTLRQLETYKSASKRFQTRYDIEAAVDWVKKWVGVK